MTKLWPGAWRKRWRLPCRAPSWFETRQALFPMHFVQPGYVTIRVIPAGLWTRRLMSMRLLAARCRINKPRAYFGLMESNDHLSSPRKWGPNTPQHRWGYWVARSSRAMTQEGWRNREPLLFRHN